VGAQGFEEIKLRKLLFNSSTGNSPEESRIDSAVYKKCDNNPRCHSGPRFEWWLDWEIYRADEWTLVAMVALDELSERI